MSEVFTWSTSAASNNSTPPDGWPENTMTFGQVNDTGREGMAAAARLYKDEHFGVAAGGVTDSFSLSMAQTRTTLSSGMIVSFVAPATNTTGSININIGGTGAGAKALRYPGGGSLSSSLVIANDFIRAAYDGTNDYWVWLNARHRPVELLLESANTFSQPQTIRLTSPYLHLWDNGGGTDAKRWWIRASGDALRFTERLDDGSFSRENIRFHHGGGITVGAVTDGDQGAGTINAVGYFLNGTEFKPPDILHYQEQRSSGSAGPTYSTGAFRTVPLSTEVVDTGGHGALSNNQVTLAAGTYEVWGAAAATAGGAMAARLRLRDVTNSVSLVAGINGGEGGGTPDAPATTLCGVFTLAGSAAVEMQISVTANTASGPVITSGEVEIYANLYLRKIA